MDLDERYRTAIRAAHETLTGPRLYSHESAAALLGLPVIDAWPKVIHLLCERRSGGRSQLDIVRHCLGLEGVDAVFVEGMAVTSPVRTAFDFALSRSFEAAVVITDAVLASVPDAGLELARLLEAHGRRRGFARARAVLAFADGRSGSPGESISRVRIDRLGYAPPDLQVAVRTQRRTEYADFGWRNGRVLGEFDGEVKYRSDRYRMGGTVEDVVIREKNRENRMRVGRDGFARWDWADLAEDRLDGILLSAGVPRRDAR